MRKEVIVRQRGRRKVSRSHRTDLGFRGLQGHRERPPTICTRVQCWDQEALEAVSVRRGRLA